MVPLDKLRIFLFPCLLHMTVHCCRRCASWRRCRCRQLRRVVVVAAVAVLSTTVVIRSY